MLTNKEEYSIVQPITLAIYIICGMLFLWMGEDEIREADDVLSEEGISLEGFLLFPIPARRENGCEGNSKNCI